MNQQRLEAQLKFDEGEVLHIYLDTKDIPTCGIGHKITVDDEEYGKPVGTPITQKRCDELFQDDLRIVESDCDILFHDFESFIEELQEIISNMLFNMGLKHLEGFHKFVADVEARDYKTAAAEMKYVNGLKPEEGLSDWFKETGARSVRLYDRMLALATL